MDTTKIEKLLKQQIIPDQVMDLNIKFNHSNEFVQELNTNNNFNVYKLNNLNIIGSSCWFNISDSIGNNKFFINNPDEDLTNIKYTRAYLNRDKSDAAQIKSSDYRTIPFETFPSNNRNFQLGDIDNVGNLVASTNTYTIYSNLIFPLSSFKVNLTQFTDYEYKISIYDYQSDVPGVIFDTTLSDSQFYSISRDYNIGLPEYVPTNQIKYKGYIISIRRKDLQFFPINIVNNNVLFNITNIAPVSTTALANNSIRIIGSYDISNTQPITVQYGYTFDYNFKLSFYHPTTKDFISSFILAPNLVYGAISEQILDNNLEGTDMFIEVQALTLRDLNDGDLTNMSYVLKDLVIGTIFNKTVTIKDGFYSGIYNSLPNTNPIIYAFETIKNLLIAELPELSITINIDLTINLINNGSDDNINISFSGDGDNSSNRLLGFYGYSDITILKNSSLTSPNPIDLDSNGRFDKIFVNIPQLLSSGFNSESNNVIFLQKGSFYLQNISTTNSNFKKSLGKNLSSIRFRLVDGINKLIGIKDTVLFSAQIECYNI